MRDAGLGLLALATAKVFLVDLASLDVAYRVLSLAALGLLLLASAWLYLRFRGQRPEPARCRGTVRRAPESLRARSPPATLEQGPAA